MPKVTQWFKSDLMPALWHTGYLNRKPAVLKNVELASAGLLRMNSTNNESG